jgi:hypothetical protein
MDNHEMLTALKTACQWDFDLWLYETWESHNVAYFDGQLSIGQINWGITAYGRALGLHSGWRNHITLHQRMIEPGEDWTGGIRGRERAASDILLHEMIHQKIYQQSGSSGAKNKSETSHNNELWVTEIRRIGRLLGYTVKADVIALKRAKTDDGSKVYRHVCPGCLTQSQLATFPHSVRPAGYYRDTEDAVFIEDFKFD